jgi:hypothetical protein
MVCTMPTIGISSGPTRRRGSDCGAGLGAVCARDRQRTREACRETAFEECDRDALELRTVKKSVSPLQWVVQFKTLALLGLVLPSGKSEAAELAVEGSFKLHIARKLSNHPSDIEGSFSVNWKDCQWIIRSKRSDQPTDYEEDGYDGKYVYSLTSIETWIRTRSEKGMRVGVNTAEGEITPGPIPFNSPEINRVLWLLYASSCYLSGARPGRLPPIASYSARHAYLYYFEQRAEWRTTGSSLPLPAFAVFYDDGHLRLWQDPDAGFMTGPPIEQSWRTPYDKGFTNAVLAVGSFCEEGNQRIPKQATFTVYGPKPNGTNADDLKVSTTFTIYASQVSLHTPIIDFKPEVRGSVVVTDRRFEREKQPIYAVPYLAEQRWLSDDEVRQKPEFLKNMQVQAVTVSASRAAAAASSKHTAVSSGVARWVVVSVLALSSVLALLLALAKGRRMPNAQ